MMGNKKNVYGLILSRKIEKKQKLVSTSFVFTLTANGFAASISGNNSDYISLDCGSISNREAWISVYHKWLRELKKQD